MDWSSLWIVVGPAIAGGIRNAAGFLGNYMEDSKLSAYEIGQLGKTVLETVVPAVCLYFGLGAFGLDVNVISASALGVLSQIFLSKLKNKVKK